MAVARARSTEPLIKSSNQPAQRTGEIIAGCCDITVGTDLRVCRFSGLSEGRWLRKQVRYDTEVAKNALAR